MAYYVVKFDGKNYASKDLYMDLRRPSWTQLMHGSVEVFNTTIFGPLTDDELAVVSARGNVVFQDLDAQLENKADAPAMANVLEVDVTEDDVYVFRMRRYILLSRVLHPGRYRVQHKMALVNVCGRKTYVCLDAVDKDIEDPIVLVAKR